METATAHTSHSEVLKYKIRLARPREQKQLNLFWHHPKFAEVYREHLIRLYYSVSASIPLLECALSRARVLSDTCPVAAALVPYLSEHIVEEQDHDEWLLEDIEELGIPRDKVTSQIPPTVVASLIGSQYYYIKHAHPVSVIAYLAIVEGEPPKKEALDDIALNKGVPKKALRTLYLHAEMDIVHSQELWTLIDDFPLLPWHTTLLGINAILVTDQLASIMEEVLASVSS